MQAQLYFGDWIHRERTKRGLRLQTLADAAQVDGSTISRIERNKTQATFMTAFQLSQALGQSLIEYVVEAYPNRTRLASEDTPILQDHDMRNFLALYQRNPNRGRVTLCAWLNKIGDHLEQKSFQPDDIDLLLSESSLYHFALKYPAQIQQATLIRIWKQGGALIPDDIGPLLAQVGQNFSANEKEALRHLSSTPLSGIKLEDAIVVDRASGIHLLEMLGSAAQFLITWHDREKLARNFMIISRWLTHLEGRNTND